MKAKHVGCAADLNTPVTDLRYNVCKSPQADGFSWRLLKDDESVSLCVGL